MVYMMVDKEKSLRVYKDGLTYIEAEQKLLETKPTVHLDLSLVHLYWPTPTLFPPKSNEMEN